MSADPELRWTSQVRRILTRANSIAHQRGDDFVGTEHVLLAMLEARGSIAVDALQRLLTVSDLADTIETLMRPEPLPGFEAHPRPWKSCVVRDSEGGYRYHANGELLQYFVDANGRPVRDRSGRLIHLVDTHKPDLGYGPVPLQHGDQSEDGHSLAAN